MKVRFFSDGTEPHPISGKHLSKKADSFTANETRGICKQNSNDDDNSSAVETAVVPLSVNYHFTRRCNYKCGFCFHTAKTSFVLPVEEAKRGLKLLKEAG